MFTHETTQGAALTLSFSGLLLIENLGKTWNTKTAIN